MKVRLGLGFGLLVGGGVRKRVGGERVEDGGFVKDGGFRRFHRCRRRGWDDGSFVVVSIVGVVGHGLFGSGQVRGDHAREFRIIHIGGRPVGCRVLGDGHRECGELQFVSDVTQRGEEFVGVVEPILGVAGGGGGHQLVHEFGHAVDPAAGLRHIRIQAGVGVLEGRVAVERGGTGQEFEEDDSGGVHVGGGGDIITRHLLWGQVGNGAHDLV